MHSKWIRELYIIIREKFIYFSYCVEQAMVIPFQNIKLSNEFGIKERLVHAIDIHRKGMESVFIILK